MSKREYRKVPAFIEVRLCDVTVKEVGSRCDGYTVATTMLDRDAYPSAWLGSLYQGRWIVEPDIGSIKCTLGLEHLRGQSPEVIEREIWTAMMTYNLVRLKMLQSGYAAEREIRSMSFTETYQLLATNWLLCACVGVNQAMATSAQAQGVCAVVGNRPGRSEPRENKRRPKVLKLMTVPRKIFKAALAALQKPLGTLAIPAPPSRWLIATVCAPAVNGNTIPLDPGDGDAAFQLKFCALTGVAQSTGVLPSTLM